MPGFIDVHVHGVAGVDVLDGDDAVAAVARALPRVWRHRGSARRAVASEPAALRRSCRHPAAAPVAGAAGAHAARVLPAHLESNFISPDYRGAQPLSCLRVPPADLAHEPGSTARAPPWRRRLLTTRASRFCGSSPRRGADVGDRDGGARTARRPRSRALAARERPSGVDRSHGRGLRPGDGGVRRRHHAGRRTSSTACRRCVTARLGLPARCSRGPDIVAELICDGFHVHPSMARVALAAKGPHGVMAITDGTAGSGLVPGARARLGSRRITVGEHAAHLDDGTLAGSTPTMDRAFRIIVTRFGASIVQAASMCATTPARALGLRRCRLADSRRPCGRDGPGPRPSRPPHVRRRPRGVRRGLNSPARPVSCPAAGPGCACWRRGNILGCTRSPSASSLCYGHRSARTTKALPAPPRTQRRRGGRGAGR